MRMRCCCWPLLPSQGTSNRACVLSEVVSRENLIVWLLIAKRCSYRHVMNIWTFYGRLFFLPSLLRMESISLVAVARYRFFQNQVQLSFSHAMAKHQCDLFLPALAHASSTSVQTLSMPNLQAKQNIKLANYHTHLSTSPEGPSRRIKIYYQLSIQHIKPLISWQ